MREIYERAVEEEAPHELADTDIRVMGLRWGGEGGAGGGMATPAGRLQMLTNPCSFMHNVHACICTSPCSTS